MKTYYIYYLPNAVRDYGKGKILYGKIGCTTDYDRRVICDKSGSDTFGPLDITGHHVLETVYGTRKEAEAIEKIWQQNNGLLDGGSTNKGRLQSLETRQKRSVSHTGKKHSIESRNKRSKSLLGHIVTNEAREKMRLKLKGVDRPKSVCPHCNKMVDAGNMKQWHGDRCKQKGTN